MNFWSYLWETCIVSGMFVNWLKNFWDWGDRVFSHPISQTVDTQIKAQSRSPTPGPGALWGPSAGPSGDLCFTHSLTLQPPPRNTAQKVGTCVGGWLLDAASCNVSYSWWSDYTHSRLIWPGCSLSQISQRKGLRNEAGLGSSSCRQALLLREFQGKVGWRSWEDLRAHSLNRFS